MHALYIGSRFVAATMGAILLYCWLFVTKNRAGKIQNRLADLWVYVANAGESQSGRIAAFLSESSAITSSVLDDIFGKKLMSTGFVVVSFFLSVASWNIANLARHSSLGILDLMDIWLGIGGWILIAILLFLPEQVAAVKHGVLISVVAIWSANQIFETFKYGGDLRQVFRDIYIVGGLGVALSLNLLFICLTRRILRSVATAAADVRRIVAALLSTLLIALALLLPTTLYAFPSIGNDWYGRFHQGTHIFFLQLFPNTGRYVAGTVIVITWVLIVGGVASFFAAFIACLVFIVMLAALLHRALWPLLRDLIENVHERRLIESPRLLGVTGIFLEMYAWPSLSWLAKLKALF